MTATPSNDPLIGRTLGGKYTLESRLGLGGFGAVYKARQVPVNRAVAVKVAHARSHDPLGPTRDRFLREATALARLQNRRVAMLFDFGEEPDGVLYMVQEFVDGRTLASLLRAEGRLTPLRVVDLGCCVLEALDEAAGLGIVHRDVKPANIMITRNARGLEQVKLVDFGLAKASLEGSDIETITGENQIPGTPPYMAPEIWQQEPLTGAVDQYGLGIVLYRALSGHLPFEQESLPALMQAHLYKAPPPFPVELGVPVQLETVVRRSLAKLPSERFSSAAAMHAALLEALPDETMPLASVQGQVDAWLLDETTQKQSPEGGDTTEQALPSVVVSDTVTAPERAPPKPPTAPPDADPDPTTPGLESPTQPVRQRARRRWRRGPVMLLLIVLASAVVGGVIAWALTRPDAPEVPITDRPALPRLDEVEAVRADPLEGETR